MSLLQKGMQKFVPKNGKNIPWRTILVFGVFYETHWHDNLKDKWRNIKIKKRLRH